MSSALAVHLPASLRAHLGEIAEREGITVDQFVASAVAEKVSALLTEDYLSARATRGTPERYAAALAQVPDAEPDADDRLDG